MKKTDLHIAFKISPTRVKIFKLEDDRVVKYSNYIDFDSDTAVCDCSAFRVKSKCQHLDFLRHSYILCFLNGMDTTSCGPLSLLNSDPFEHIYIMKEGMWGIASKGFKTASSAIAFVQELVSPVGESFRGDNNNIRKIYSQLCFSDINNCGLMNNKLLAVTSSDEIETISERTELPAFHKTRRPDVSDFYVEEETWEQCVYAVSEGANILFTGPSGCGKSELCYRVSSALEYNLEAFNMGAMSEPRTSLIGNINFDKEKGTWFSESRFVKAITKERNVILLDEITRANEAAFNILLPLLDGQGYLALDEHEGAMVIKRHEKVSFMSTANIGMEYTGTKAMDKALKDRFAVIIDLFFPLAAHEERILCGRVKGLSKPAARRLCGIAQRQRDLCRHEDEFSEYISTRMLLEAAKQIAVGLDFKVACKFTIQNHFSAEGGDDSERIKISRIIEKGV